MNVGVVVENERHAEAVQINSEAEYVEDDDSEQVNLVGFAGEFQEFSLTPRASRDSLPGESAP